VNSTSQRINPDRLVDLLIATFGRSAIREFRKFLTKHPIVTKWMIASDFVINESQAASDAYAYTFFPYNAEIQDLKAKIVKLVPKDFKKTKTVKPKLHERNIEVVGWFPDRDNITTSYERIADHLFAVNFSAFCQRHKIDEYPIKTLIGLPEPDPGKPKQTWYDELVRIPDFLAGPLAGWDYRKNLVTGRQKYLEILQDAVADNPYLITLLLTDRENGIGVSRLLCSKDPIPNQCPEAG
jgi:hypothetical protein